MEQISNKEAISYNAELQIAPNDTMTYLFFKRAIDIFGAVIGLVILSVVFIAVSLLIKVEDPRGPVFFAQERVGKKGNKFKMYKFRSMVVDAEDKLKDLLELNETTGAMFKMKNDPRITKIGKFIRKTSIDELPQLWNVLKGDMSLVGPRPPLLREVLEYTAYDKQRLLVKPGCTGPWQVSGRSNIGFEEMVELDLIYIKTRNCKADINLILKTIKIILMPNKGAF
ncbi:sugar transferase [Priestia megaterium]|uniref:sugar transferase n=1 Tax=Priestia megaterium TaxID=1404 RepID=UPI00387A0003